MSAPSLPPDNSASIRQMELDSQRQEQARQDAAAAQKKAELASLRTSASSTGRQGAYDYFTSQGLDPNEYSSDIDSRINNILNGISPDDPNPGSYFTNAGSTIFNASQDAARTKAGRELDGYFAPNFETSRVPLTLDDPYLEGVRSEQRSKADDIIRNMLDRGVITSSGFNAAEGDLDKQTPGVNARLGEVGTNLLTEEQGKLRDIANKGRSTAQTLSLGTKFNAGNFGNEADTSFNDFLSHLGEQIRAGAPGNLFNTSGLGAIAGAAQGAQNTVFDPDAAAGILTDDQPKKDQTKSAIF